MRNRNAFFIGLFLLIASDSHATGDPASQRNSSYPQKDVEQIKSVLDSVRAAMMSPEGLIMNVDWQYQYDDEMEMGEGTVEFLQDRFIRLVLPFQETLIKEDVMMTRYSQTDQVILDKFDTMGSSPWFSILSGNFSGFVPVSLTRLPSNRMKLEFASDSGVGFDKLFLVIDTEKWRPVDLMGDSVSGKIRLKVHVKSSQALADPESLVKAKLTGKEVIDLRY